MTYLIRRAVVLGVLLAVAAAGVWAQGPTGGGTGGERPPLTIDDLDLMTSAGFCRIRRGSSTSSRRCWQSRCRNWSMRSAPEIQANVSALEASAATSTVRYAALILGVLILLYARRAKAWSWVALGAVVGLTVAPLPLVDTVQQELFTGELSFLLDDPLATLLGDSPSAR
ncbi:MAG: hypothetical protein HND48_17205 [Chloroflexi bacterium]|nr:hypothetical protein [Chloroflexota bacterium]